MTRERLKDTRTAKTCHFVVYATQKDERGEDKIVEIDGYITSGEYKDGRLGEVFVKMGKQGDDASIYDQWATAFSLALQHGADVDKLCEKFINTRFEPSGATSVPGIRHCTSLVDLVSRWLLKEYGTKAPDTETTGNAGKENDDA